MAVIACLSGGGDGAACVAVDLTAPLVLKPACDGSSSFMGVQHRNVRRHREARYTRPEESLRVDMGSGFRVGVPMVVLQRPDHGLGDASWQ